MSNQTTRKAMELVGKTEFEWVDAAVGGLSIRGRKTGASWILRSRLHGKLSTWTIGPIGSVGLKEARERAQYAKHLLRSGNDPKDWLIEQLAHMPVVHPVDAPLSASGLTWDECAERFLAFVKENRKPKTYTDYKNTLGLKYVSPLQNRILKEVTKQDIRKIQEEVFSLGYQVQSDHILTIIKSFLSWVAEQSWSDIDVNVASTLKKIEGRKISAKKTLPKTSDLGALAWQVQDSHPTIRTAVLLLLFTAQRIESVYSAKKADFVNDDDGNIIWAIPPSHMKGSQPHPLPLSGLIWGLVRQAQIIKPTHEFLFPQLKMRSAKNPTLDGSVSYKALKNHFPDSFNPHDVRRAFTTYLEEECRINHSDVKLVLDHSEGRGRDVTLRHYHMGQHMGTKRRVLEAWENFVLDCIRSVSPDGMSLPLYMQ